MRDALFSMGITDDLASVTLSGAIRQDVLLVIGWFALIGIVWLVMVALEIYARTRPDIASSEALHGSMIENFQAVAGNTRLFAAASDRFLQIALMLLIALPFEILLYLLVDASLEIKGGLFSETFSINIISGSWLNSYHVQILPFIAEPFSIFLFYQFFIGIPKDFDEAAYVDGAGPFQIYWQIIVPLSRPVFATVAILKFLQFWSFYLWPLMVTRGDEFQPLMVGMDFFQTQAPIKWGSIMGYAAMVTIPVLITFLLFQKWFVQSVSSSGVKGGG
ncbi:MAG: carbohydrate ABC transporter permease [Anaerolineae bacterium]|nr:carbohydrate ABC transporter permease [Anaerolineae bacterium]